MRLESNYYYYYVDCGCEDLKLRAKSYQMEHFNAWRADDDDDVDDASARVCAFISLLLAMYIAVMCSNWAW